jgi:hypothetical protein
MSRIYFHSPSGDAELRGSERAWLASLANGLAEAAWDLDRSHGYERAVEILALAPEVPDRGHGENYLHTSLRKAQEQEARNAAAWAQLPAGQRFPTTTDYAPQQQLVSSLRTALRVQGIDLEVAGHRLRSADVDRNTALVAGSDPVRLAAKIDGWCECHCWVEGSNRAWMADIIDDGLRAGLYRRGLWYADGPNAPKDRWSDQGWGEVLTLLRSRDDEPVVLSYSVCDPFPYAFISDDQTDTSAEEKWLIAMDELRADRPWARLAPETLAEVTFGPPVTVYDLFAPDRDERVRAAFAATSA